MCIETDKNRAKLDLEMLEQASLLKPPAKLTLRLKSGNGSCVLRSK